MDLCHPAGVEFRNKLKILRLWQYEHSHLGENMEHKQRIQAAEMTFFRSEVSRLDKLRNDVIREEVKKLITHRKKWQNTDETGD